MSATMGAALKKIAVALLTDKKVIKTIGGIIIGIIIIVVMPIVAVVSVFNGSMDIDTDKLNQSIQENISAEQMENLQLINDTMTEVENQLKNKKLSDYNTQAEVIYLFSLSDKSDDKDFVKNFVSCFKKNQSDEDLIKTVNQKFGTEIKYDEFQKMMQSIKGAEISTSGFTDKTTKNNLDLVKWCENAYKNGWGYVYGGYGQVCTKQYLDQQASLFPSNNEAGGEMREVGDEFKTARHHLLKNLDGNIAWKDSAQAEKQNQCSASDFISRVMEDYAYEISGRKAYVDYIATRPRAERFGSHGLFTDDGVQVQLSKVTEELDRHKGNVWTAIISIRREDAERLGFNTGARWRDMLRTQTEALAKNLKIPMENLRWYAAFHNESYHPHVHLIAYSTKPNEAYLTEKGIENIKSNLAKVIFRQDLISIYQKQTEHRDKLRAEARDIVDDLVSKINSEIYISVSIQHKLLELADRLSKTKGKKVYGYLKPDVKAIVDSIVEELANDSRIKKLYDLWYEQKENTIRTYTDEIPDRIPLAKNKEFKSIKNAIIKEALKLIPNEDEVESKENTDEESVSNPFEYEENTSAESVFDSDRDVLYPRYSIKTNRNSVAFSSLYLLRYLCNMIQNKLRFEEKQKAQRTDKKLQQKINDKKQAQGLKM